MEKSRLRRLVIERRSAMPDHLRQIASAQAIAHFHNEIELAKTSIVALYWPIGDELDCRGLMEQLIANGHTIVLPCIVGSEQPLIFREYDGEGELAAAGFGTREPSSSAKILLPDLIALPLLGFDQTGNRLGYGKGFYDRTISSMAKKPKLCGLAFSVQELENIPVGSHDVPLEKIITENGQAVGS